MALVQMIRIIAIELLPEMKVCKYEAVLRPKCSRIL
jgi:hypothetical protein